MWMKKRAAGVLLPVSSLPGPSGIGTFGQAAYDWVDFLVEAGQRYWQVLPLGPTGFGDSPYQSFSAYAGNPYFIDLNMLVRQALLTRAEVDACDFGTGDAVDYARLFELREPLLKRAHARLTDRASLDEFRRANREWLTDYALFMAIKKEQKLDPWWLWPNELKLRDARAMDNARKALADDIDYQVFVQWLFFTQWQALKAYANRRGLLIIGDIPIYAAMDSADVWADGALFMLDKDMCPTAVAGVPPDGFSKTGQLWGNPLYRWDEMERTGYDWWIRRIKHELSLFDVLRIDHFRGFDSYYAVPYGHADASRGRWVKGPGIDFVSAVNRALGSGARIIAEDLGYLTDDVKRLLDASGYPGMKVLEFAFDSREESDYMPHNYVHHSVVYTGTHDNDTVRGWFETAPAADVALACEYLGISDRDAGHWAFIRAALGSIANLAIIPIQDYLGLTSAARINTPSTLGGNNWRWRMRSRDMSEELSQQMRRMTRLYGRLYTP